MEIICSPTDPLSFSDVELAEVERAKDWRWHLCLSLPSFPCSPPQNKQHNFSFGAYGHIECEERGNREKKKDAENIIA